MTKIQNSNPCFGHLLLTLWNFALGEPAGGRIPQGENLVFVWDLVLEIWNLIGSIGAASEGRPKSGP
jgi:hypothetical protein